MPAEDQVAGEEFVTVREAAQRLGIAPRQARRYADRLPPADRDTGTGTGEGQSPLRVRYAALAALRESAKTGANGRDSGENRDRDTEGHVPGGDPAARMQLAAVYETLLREKDARIADLQAALEDARRRADQNAEALARTMLMGAGWAINLAVAERLISRERHIRLSIKPTLALTTP